MDVIIGAGLAGLTAGIDLAKMKRDVTILEREDNVGGLAASYRLPDGYTHDCGFHVIIPDAAPLYEMVRLAGVEENLIHFNMKFGFMKNKRIYSFYPGSVSLMKFKLLNVKEKIKFGMLMKNIESLEEEQHSGLTAEEFIEENIGEQAYLSFFEPLLGRLSGIPPEKLSSAFFIEFCKLLVKVKNHEFCYPRRGIGELCEGMASYHRSLKGRLETGSCVKKISLDGDRVAEVIYEKEGKEAKIHASNVVSTILLSELPDIVDLPAEYKERLKKMTTTEIIVSYFGTNGKLSRYDMEVMVPRKEGLCFNSFIEVSNISKDVAPDGKGLLSVVASEHLIKDHAGDEEILDAITNDMKRLFPHFEEKVKWRKIVRCKYPAVTKEYMHFRPEFVTPIRGLYLAGAQMFPIPDMPTAIVSGHIVSGLIGGTGSLNPNST